MPTAPATIPARCEALRERGFEFLLTSTPVNLASYDLAPFGVALEPVPFLAPNPYGWDTESFIRLFHSMDTHVFQGRGLTMPNWVLVDHALMSSGLMVIGLRGERMAEAGKAFGLGPMELSVLGGLAAEAEERGYDGPIPIASYCAAPTAHPDHRVGWSLCSVMPRSGLAFLAKALALGAFRARFLSGTTQYDNLALRVHTKFGPARVRAAVVDIHTAAHTLVYETDLGPWLGTEPGLDPGTEPTRLVAAHDHVEHGELQRMIDEGSHVVTILPPGLLIQGDERLVPVHITEKAA